MDINEINAIRAELHSDWLQRDADGYVFRGTGNVFEWMKHLPKGGSYSSLRMNEKDPEDVLKKAYNMAYRTILSMHLPVRPTLGFDSGSHTDGSNIALATDMFDDSDLDLFQKLDIFIGLAVHEAGHILHSDFNVIQSCNDSMTASLLNIVEDEREERAVTRERASLANFLRAVKLYHFVKYRKNNRIKLDSQKPLNRLVNAIIALVRYPSTISDKEIEDFSEPLLRVKHECLEPVASNENATTADMLDVAMKIKQIIVDFLKQPEQSEQPSGNDKQESSDSGDDGDNRQQNGRHSMTEKDIQDGLDAMSKTIGRLTRSPEHGLNDDDMSENVRRNANILTKICRGTCERTNDGSLVNNVTTDSDARDRYRESLSRMRRWIPAMRDAIECNAQHNRYVVRGQLSGRLDTGRFTQMAAGCDNVYRRKGEVRGGRTAVCVLIDESGSMWGDNIENARDLAVLLNEVLRDLPNVDTFFYGHTTMKEPGKQGYSVSIDDFNNGDREALGALRADAGNVDDIAIRNVADMVRRQTDEKVLMFVLSDGAPCFPESGLDAVRRMRRTLDAVAERNISVVSVGIDFCTAGLYPHHIDFDAATMSQFPQKLGRIITDAVQQNTARE